jgi:hypothetical protein
VAARQCPAYNQAAVSVTALNDPFTFTSGGAVRTLADWECRKTEIRSLLAFYELGDKPARPSTFTASYSGTTLSMQSSEGGRSMSFSVTIRVPSGSGPHPAIIGLGGGNIPIPSNVGLINFNQDTIAQQASGSSRGQGSFFTLYGNTHSAGALTAWAWAVSRIIDALEMTTGHNIDPKRVGITGCSRNGKGAMVGGALEDRIALTLPQESGSGGAACWRLSRDMQQRGMNVQTATQIVGENVWFSTRFNNYVSNVNQLPFDHHMLAGLVAPRGMFVMEGPTDWLGPWSTMGCMTAARKIYQAHGAQDRMGYSLIGGHQHCQFPSGWQSNLSAFINRFLFNQAASTNVWSYSGGSGSFSESQWCPWTVPTLSGSVGTTSTPPVTSTTTTPGVTTTT